MTRLLTKFKYMLKRYATVKYTLQKYVLYCRVFICFYAKMLVSCGLLEQSFDARCFRREIFNTIKKLPCESCINDPSHLHKTHTAYTHTYTHTYTHKYTPPYIHTHTCTCIHIRTCIHTHTHTHMHTDRQR